MNTPDPYVRDPERSLVTEHPIALAEVSQLAIHGDPSLRRQAPSADSKGSNRLIAWVRPSELPMMMGTGVLRQAVDVQAESTRRIRRAPARITRSMIARPAPTNPGPAEGLSR
jgi:hypothetical protein